VGTRFFARPDRPWGPPKMGTGSFPGAKCGRGVLLITHHPLVPLSWKSRDLYPPSGPHRACNGNTLPFFTFIYVYIYIYIYIYIYDSLRLIMKTAVWCLQCSAIQYIIPARLSYIILNTTCTLPRFIQHEPNNIFAEWNLCKCLGQIFRRTCYHLDSAVNSTDSRHLQVHCCVP